MIVRDRHPLFRALLVILLAAGCQLPFRTENSEEPGDRINRYLDSIYAPGEPGAAVLIERNEEVLLGRGYGLANLDWKIPISTTTVFRLGSITKQFTAMAILMLAETGKLDLSAPIYKLLPESKESATVEQLLTHTSGLGSYSQSASFASWSRMDMMPADVLSLIRDQPRVFKPGADWAYSDSGYFLLGMLIEKISGDRYANFIRSRIFSPLGMKHSYYDDGISIIPARSSGYMKLHGRFINAPFLSMTIPFAAGSLASSVEDLAIWDRSLYGDKLVSHEWLKRAFTPYRLADGRSTHYGYGWSINDFHGQTVVEHGGQISGYEGHVLRIPAEHILVVVLGNCSGRDPNADYVATKILTYLKAEGEPAVTELTDQEKEDYVGKYCFTDGSICSVLLTRSRLLLRRKDGATIELLAHRKDEFGYKNSFNRILFSRNHRGTIIGMSVKTQYGLERTASRTSFGVD